MERPQLFQVLLDNFNMAELLEVCFLMEIDHENFAQQKQLFVQDLITYCERHKRLSELLEVCKTRWPKLEWPSYHVQDRNRPNPERLPLKSTKYDSEALSRYRDAMANKPEYFQWGDASKDEFYIHEEGKFLPIYVFPYDQYSAPSKSLLSSIYSRKRLIILGEPGSGKTVTLQRVMWEASRSQFIVPVFVPLLYYNGDIFESIRVALCESDILCINDTNSLKQFLKQETCTILLDGLNEIPGNSRRHAENQIVNLMREFPQHKYMLTSRIQDELWRRLRAAGIVKDAVVIQQISEAQALAYLIAHLGERRGKDLYDRLNERLRGLSRTPLLLWLIKAAGLQGRELPGNRGELFDSFINQMLERDARLESFKFLTERVKRIGKMKQALAQLAFFLQDSHRLACTYKQAEGVLTAYLTSPAYRGSIRKQKKEKAKPKQAKNDAKKILDGALRNGLLQGEAKISFMHQSMQAA